MLRVMLGFWPCYSIMLQHRLMHQALFLPLAQSRRCMRLLGSICGPERLPN